MHLKLKASYLANIFAHIENDEELSKELLVLYSNATRNYLLKNACKPILDTQSQCNKLPCKARGNGTTELAC